MPVLPSKSSGFSRDPTTEKSLRHSIKDGVAFALMTGSSESYFSAFAIFLKASPQQVALLASLPPLLASFSQIFSVYIGQHTGARKNIIVAGAVVQFVALTMIALMPLVFEGDLFSYLLGFVILYFIGPNLGSPLWGSLMGAIVPESIRGRFFATRTRLSSVASFTALLAAGLVLHIFDGIALTYYGFLATFGIGVIARIVSTWHLTQMHDPPHEHSIDGDVVRLFRKRFFQGEARFLHFSFFNACMQGAVAISGPLVVVYLLNVLEYSYLALTLNTAASILVQFAVLSRWGRLSDLFGNRIILRLTGFTIPFIPVLWTLSSDFYYLLLVQALSGLVWSGFSLSASNFVYDLTGHHKRAGLMAVHAVLSASAIFVGASLGGWLAMNMPTELTWNDYAFSWLTAIYGVFVISSVVRLMVATIFLPRLKEARTVKPMSYHGLFFRVTRFSPVSGLIFEAIARRTNRDQED